MKAIAYLRVSTKAQGQSGLGLEAQRELIDRFLAARSGVIVQEYVDVISGAKTHRETLQKAIAHAKSIGAVLVIAKLDRISRSVSFISALMDTGVEFKVADMPEATKFQLHLYAALAEEERRLISERTKSALRAAKLRGVVLGKTAKNLAAIKKQKADSYASEIQPVISPLVSQGLPMLTIAKHLNNMNFKSRNGGKWYAATVSRVCKRLELV